jgi:hypothetical protein
MRTVVRFKRNLVHVIGYLEGKVMLAPVHDMILPTEISFEIACYHIRKMAGVLVGRFVYRTEGALC